MTVNASPSPLPVEFFSILDTAGGLLVLRIVSVFVLQRQRTRCSLEHNTD